MSASNTIYLITGATRGIGRGLVETYLARPSTTVVAAVRNPADSSAQSLTQLPAGSSSKLIVVRIDSLDEGSAATAVEQLANEHSITYLDVVIANAGVGTGMPKVADVKISDIDLHVRVNGYGPVILFQATLPALNKATAPKFIIISSSGGTIAGMEDICVPHASYGPSKALVNYLGRKMHFEHENITTFSIHPGWVKTEMGEFAAKLCGMDGAKITLEESVNGIASVVDNATRETTSGRFFQWNGDTLPW
ncbi:uncharacterized protein K452DRAFT_354223 [Aplosporella prunicola CBS 121167]|uniref:NAD(P)-binding protein n=1 Tax=Aplosporella prunicola CBS 121167 TaxID=1176127 RepID=A0A6A6AV63_9PEZI|nr:uncharacterized protein K452DRAFT_354223 [Aplosporella prunicola CBS 121167]KAF2135829.1 hypothetical protein K452DRAFT_354223 [Aplosporella prunicola CBS 121167]